ncbi:MAG: 4-hydroxythreonine-4-phosphate dehydrogenase PdxA [Pseudomonadota bacterium]|nr:4-hydroxythreonine-4-phosphate dehydrogenase PdxA [Pseudomonadota bacterium]
MSNVAPIALTMGDPAGIGGEISLISWIKHKIELPAFYILDDPSRLDQLARKTGLRCPIEEIKSPLEAISVYKNALPVLALSKPVVSLPGDGSDADSEMVVESIDRAVDATIEGTASAMVTNPIQKRLLYQAGFPSPGHTEYLGLRAGLQRPPIMLLAGPHLMVVPVTIHVSLKDAIAALTRSEIVRTLKLTVDTLKKDFGIANPRIAVSGLNPHAGEGGHMGREEIETIAPAILEATTPSCTIDGPLAADTMFHETARKKYDVAVCMYHDQALIPMKTLDFDDGVNITGGLPFVRTSPDHGTAYNIAGTAKAKPASLVSAIKMAEKIFQHRAKFADCRAGD